jgi:hypothetical protein
MASTRDAGTGCRKSIRTNWNYGRIVGWRVANDASGDVDDEGAVAEAGPGGYIGEVGHQELAGRRQGPFGRHGGICHHLVVPFAPV